MPLAKPTQSGFDFNFSNNAIETINIFHQSNKNDKIDGTNGINMQLPKIAKMALLHLFNEANIPASKGVRDMITDYIDLFPHREKFRRHKKLLLAMMKELP